MLRWGVVVSGFYAAVVLLLLLPGMLLLGARHTPAMDEVLEMYLDGFPLLYAGILVGGAALLLFLSVDTAWRRMQPRRHVAVTAGLASFFAAALAFCVLLCFEVAVYADHPPPLWEGREDLFLATALGAWMSLWMIWGTLFYRHYRDSSSAVSAVVTWLLKGSVLELLVAVPCHVIVRQRGDCSAPFVTGFGIVTGIAIMLLCFGPGVIALYRKRLDEYGENARQRS